MKIEFLLKSLLVIFCLCISSKYSNAASANTKSPPKNTATAGSQSPAVQATTGVNQSNTGSAPTNSEVPVSGVAQSDSEKTKAKNNKKKDAAALSVEEEKNDEPIEFNDQKGILAGLDYPELQVVPRASERLALEAHEEKTRLISPYWPVQLSAITLMVAGIMSNGKYINTSSDADKNDARKSENQFSSQLALLTGGLWLGTTYYMTHYLSYGEALQDIKKINGKDKKNALLRERLAEEALERPARVTYLINTLSVWTTLLSSIYVASHTNQVSPSYAGIAAAMAFMPWLIDNRITRTWEKHQEYKRKIYAPLTMGTWQYDLEKKIWNPVITMNWEF